MVSFLVNFLSEPTIVMGLVAMIGLIAMRNSASNVIQGTMKTILGFLILSAGSSLICTALVPFSTMFNAAFGISGVVPEDNALVAAVQTVLGFETPMIMLFSFVINIILARVTPWKYIFLTGHMMFSFAGTMAIVLDNMDIHGWTAILIGSLIQGICMVLFPAIAQPFTRKILGTDDVAFGFWGSSLIVFTGWIGKLCAKKDRNEEEDTWEKVHVSEKFNFLKDMSILMSIVMIVVYLFTALVAGGSVVGELAGSQNPVVYTLIQAMTFVAGVLVLLQGVRMFLGEIVPAFVGITEKFIPGAKPALDCPVVFPYAPTATVLGFISAYVAGLICMFVMAAMKTTVMIPVAIPFFFIGATAGVFGNARGGWKGCVLGAFITGILISVGPAIIYPIMQSVGLSGTSFPETDFNLIGIIFNFIGKALGKW